MLNHAKDTALARGIKAVGVGKRGSKALESGLIQDILTKLDKSEVPDVIKGAFFGALMIKGVTIEEKLLEKAFTPGIFSKPQKLVDTLAPDAPLQIKQACVKLLQKATLTEQEAKESGEFLFSKEGGDGARGMIASILRVRYETPDEYAGLLTSMHQTIEKSFKTIAPEGDPIIQIAEPFDGVDHSNLITPLIAEYLQSHNYRVVSLVGRNSGPKFGNNLLDLAKVLDGSFLRQLKDFTSKPSYGWYLNQQDMSKAIDHWVELRRSIIKRPFLATLERFVNPVNAKIVIASAFHPPYGDKMLTICERAGYPGAIIIRNGLEGTIAFPLKRAAKILCTAKQKSGFYKRYEFEIQPSQYIKEEISIEEKFESPSLEKNAKLIKEYNEKGSTTYQLFNFRIKVTCIGIMKAIEWIENNINR